MYHAHPHAALLAPTLVLLAGAFIRHGLLWSHAPIPYTVMLLILGAAIGLLLRYFNSDPMEELEREGCDFTTSLPLWDDVAQYSFRMLGDVDPHLMLDVFLPPLIFESAFAIEWHIFDQLKWMTLILAIPGVLVSTFTLGALINAVMMPDGTPAPGAGDCAGECSKSVAGWETVWSSSAGNLLGCILSATDPVAVVALLKELGVKAELSIGIEGESLLNDGTALVIFTVLGKMVQLPDATALPLERVIWDFLFMAGCGALWGLAIGIVTVFWLSTIFNMPSVEITITLAAAYLTFLSAEALRMSGVLAVVALGLYMGKNGKTRISPEARAARRTPSPRAPRAAPRVCAVRARHGPARRA